MVSVTRIGGSTGAEAEAVVATAALEPPPSGVLSSHQPAFWLNCGSVRGVLWGCHACCTASVNRLHMLYAQALYTEGHSTMKNATQARR